MEQYTKFETARVIGARALQIRMGAPILVDVPKTISQPSDIARIELQKDVLPITVKEIPIEAMAPKAGRKQAIYEEPDEESEVDADKTESDSEESEDANAEDSTEEKESENA
jgi:DNA-directed RNA polymerase subunit K